MAGFISDARCPARRGDSHFIFGWRCKRCGLIHYNKRLKCPVRRDADRVPGKDIGKIVEVPTVRIAASQRRATVSASALR